MLFEIQNQIFVSIRCPRGLSSQRSSVIIWFEMSDVLITHLRHAHKYSSLTCWNLLQMQDPVASRSVLIRFRSSAHPAGPNGPSCLDLKIYVPFCFRNKDPYPYGIPYPCPYPWLRPAQCSLSSFPVFVLILLRIQLFGFALVIILSLGWIWEALRQK